MRSLPLNRTIHSASLKIILFNVVCLFLYMLVFPWIQAAVQYATGVQPHAHDDVAVRRLLESLDWMYGLLFQLCYCWPMVIVAMIASSFPLQEIADITTQQLRGGVVAVAPLDKVRMLYRSVLSIAIYACKFVPAVLPLLVRLVLALAVGQRAAGIAAGLVSALVVLADVLATALLYAFFAVEMTTADVTLEARLVSFEERAAFFAGLGLPFALASYAAAFIPGAIIYFVLSPAFVIATVLALRDPCLREPSLARPLPLFAAPKALASLALLPALALLRSWLLGAAAAPSADDRARAKTD